MAETILITGGSGFIGLKLAGELTAAGRRVVIFDLKPPEFPSGQKTEDVVFIRGDITSLSQVLNAVRDQKADGIIHLAALLSEPSEANPWASINVNAMGAYHVFEAARLFGAHKVLLSSSMAVYVNPENSGKVVTADTAQRPQVIYGITKTFSELLGLYYQRKFGVDVRGVRIPGLIGPNVESPGFAQYNSRMIQSAIKGTPFEVTVPEDTVIPLLYVKDAVRSLAMLYDAPEEKLVTRIYNIGQILPAPSAADILATIRSFYPSARITFAPDPLATRVARDTPREIRCDEARNEWGWSVAYGLKETVKDFITEVGEERNR
jgi:threonine 3-dehydrogenase